MSKQWYVYNMDDGGEVSVNYGNPKDHHKSYGWPDIDKIIIAEDCDRRRKPKAIKLATIIAESLNNNNFKI